ncbi:response regulator transcription factor [Synechococcus sp. PCC 7336]|uniref:response regulator transcription factor n=1 Tax=Synechococcus sp. PCC 7336 TaxID=195250 RepID=UPI00034B1A84|nr:response regulator transcription factor [Synechococcus sp. PCC 7336]
MSPLQIQIVEGNPHLRTLLSWQLEKAGHIVRSCGSIQQAQAPLKRNITHILVLDGDLPDNSGLEFCRWAYQQMDAAIVLLSAKDSEADIVAGLEAGADDYLTKPMSMQVFTARVEAIARRIKRCTPPSCLNYPSLRIDLVQRQVTVSERAVELTPQEFSLLFVLAQAAGEALSRSELLRRAWPDAIDNPRTVDTHILSLRKKLETNPQQPHLIQTVRNVGYRLYPDAATSPHGTLASRSSNGKFAAVVGR